MTLGAIALALLVGRDAQAGATFDAVKARGELVCGVHTGLFGFAAPDDKGAWKGLDVDMCRAVAAAVLGNAAKVRYVPLSAQARLTALQSGEIDMLARNTTWTLTRDTANGLNFTNVNYYDGQGFMVGKAAGIKSAKELSGATVCVQTGTTTELNLADYFRANKLELKPVTIEKYEEVTAAYFAGRCDAITSDVSQLAAIRQIMVNLRINAFRICAQPVSQNSILICPAILQHPMAIPGVISFGSLHAQIPAAVRHQLRKVHANIISIFTGEGMRLVLAIQRSINLHAREAVSKIKARNIVPIILFSIICIIAQQPMLVELLEHRHTLQPNRKRIRRHNIYAHTNKSCMVLFQRRTGTCDSVALQPAGEDVDISLTQEFQRTVVKGVRL